jgi:TPP-dependent indolepyruvate ferredoxin oxidoreductase alpha subunit
MTGCQQNPGTDLSLQRRKLKRMSIESVLNPAGIEVFQAGDGFGDKAALAAFLRECLEREKLAVLLVTGPCPNPTGKVC